MIKQVDISFFQSHKKSIIPFGPGVNAIIGISDHGKTVILRAINWALNNKPSGSSICSRFAGKEITEVELEFTEGVRIGRTRNAASTTNKYYLNGEEFSAFGQDVPQEILDASHMQDINISSQLDPPFLLSASSGEVARFLNQIAGLDKIDTALGNIDGVIRGFKKDSKFQEAEVIRVDKKISEYDYLVEAEQSLYELELLDYGATVARDKLEKLSETITAANLIKAQMVGVSTLIAAETDAKALLADTALLLAEVVREERLSSLIADNSFLSNKILSLSNLLPAEKPIKELETLISDQVGLAILTHKLDGFIKNISRNVQRIEVVTKTAVGKEEVEGILQLIEQKESGQVAAQKLYQLIISVRNKSLCYDNCEKDLEAYEERWQEEMPLTCPLCGRTD